ncbi:MULTISPECIES: Crp/Fnr family transcriptional regulator [Brevundimonas]|uniref:HTH crp-type domain-containing protein n=1 Tax=Brevundimonas nasdae TaxID=172043 RepID=A0A0B4CSN0_9CAUL|nr:MULTISPECIES: Crp/Fnr family transcriptional regulator [Brevundimonas]KIC55170.1 hypothetical protein RM53_15465 [Brevundimonas nasdae]KJV38833.1 hypothetical protein VH88_14065 [Brevundimonas sp. KM4]
MHDRLAIMLDRLEGASADDRGVFAALISETRVISAGQVLVEEGSRPQVSMILLEGFVGRVSILSEGGRQISGLHVPADFVDLHSLLLKKMDHSLVALTNVAVAAVSHADLRRVCETRPRLMRALWRETLVDGAIHREWLSALGRRLAAERLALLFCEIYVRLNAVGLADNYRFDLPLTQSDVADMVGITPVHVNRSLKALRQQGVVEWRGGTAIINDWRNLARFAQFDPTYLEARLTADQV